jgi:hypothetical protein
VVKAVMTMIRTYTELIKLPTFAERLAYLDLYGRVCDATFGDDRIFNQKFYSSSEWRRVRNAVIARDNGCDLGIEECAIPDGVTIYIHHLEPITIEDIMLGSNKLLDPENLITTIFDTHQIIHYGRKNKINLPQERTPNDTCPWKR